VSHRSWVVAEALYERCNEEAKRSGIFFLDEKREHAVERIHSAVAGIAQAIEAELPLELRRKGEARFRIDWKEGEKVMGSWEGDPRNLTFDLRELFEQHGQLHGELPAQAGEMLAKVLVRDLFGDNASLPGFRRARESTKMTIWLEWLLPTVMAQLLHVQGRQALAGG